MGLIAGPVQGIEELALDVGDLNGDSRDALGVTAWWGIQLRFFSLSEFVKASRTRQAIKVSAKQRISLACVVGFVFSATRGFTLQMEHNHGKYYDTARHERATDTFFEKILISAQQEALEGIVVISFPTPSREDVLAYLSNGPLDGVPKLFLDSTMPIGDGTVFNTSIVEAKGEILAFRGKYQLACIHLFVKAPSFFAMSLGNRLNGVCELLLYDWIEGSYQQTAMISSFNHLN